MSQYDDPDVERLMRTLTENFNVLADEVQLLSDRKTILEHKLRFAHEQYQYLADKYAPADSEISSTLAKLQIPPDLQVLSPDGANFVPIPLRRPARAKQETAEAIRDGRRASQRIAFLKGWTNTSSSGGYSGNFSPTTSSNMRTSRRGTSSTTLLEQDFTVPGKKSQLLCPFTANSTPMDTKDKSSSPEPVSKLDLGVVQDNTPHHSSDPICAAMYAETLPSPARSATGSAAKCPIRYLDQHSPEEVARYFETHKHEIPRSHEVCVKRYQRNEEDIRKLDAKYGNLVNMLQGLGQKHQPLLPAKDGVSGYEVDKKSAERVENWAKAVSADEVEKVEAIPDNIEEHEEREGRFDRPMREVRVGESPSRPWGIQIPFVQPASQIVAREEITAPVPVSASAKPEGKCPIDHGAKLFAVPQPAPEARPQTGLPPQPSFLQTPDLTKMAANAVPQMVFTGPVFIGYPLDQAMALMKQWQSTTYERERS